MKYEIEKWFEFLNWKLTEEEMKQTLSFFSNDRKHVREQFDNLSWYASEKDQLYAIDYLSSHLFPHEYIYLILPQKLELIPCNNTSKYYSAEGGKERWENAAKTILQIGWPKADNIIVPLFIWLLDPNWPGSKQIYDFLLSLPRDKLRQKMEKIITDPEAYDEFTFADLKLQISDLCADANMDMITDS